MRAHPRTVGADSGLGLFFVLRKLCVEAGNPPLEGFSAVETESPLACPPHVGSRTNDVAEFTRSIDVRELRLIPSGWRPQNALHVFFQSVNDTTGLRPIDHLRVCRPDAASFLNG